MLAPFSYLYHGDGDYDMHTKAPVAINWYKRLFPEINVEVMKACAGQPLRHTQCDGRTTEPHDNSCLLRLDRHSQLC